MIGVTLIAIKQAVISIRQLQWLDNAKWLSFVGIGWGLLAWNWHWCFRWFGCTWMVDCRKWAQNGVNQHKKLRLRQFNSIWGWPELFFLNGWIELDRQIQCSTYLVRNWQHKIAISWFPWPFLDAWRCSKATGCLVEEVLSAWISGGAFVSLVSAIFEFC